MTGSAPNHIHVVRLAAQPMGAHPCGAHPCIVVTSGVTHATSGTSATKTLCGVAFTLDHSAAVPAVRRNCAECVDLVAEQLARR